MYDKDNNNEYFGNSEANSGDIRSNNGNETYYNSSSESADTESINNTQSEKAENNADAGYYNSNTEDNSSNGYYNSNTESNTSNGYYNSNAESNTGNGYYNNDASGNSYYSNSSDNFDGKYYNSNSGDDSNKGKKNKRKGLITALIITAVVVVISIVALVMEAVDEFGSGDNKTGIEQFLENRDDEKSDKYEDIGSTNTKDNSVNNGSGSVYVTDVSGVVDEAMPSVVAITSKTLVESNRYSQDFWNYYFNGGNGGSQTYEQEAAGSGIIIDQTDTELLIVTNNHVVEGSDSLKIQFNGDDANESVDGYIKGTDSSADVAVVAVKLEDIPKDTLKNIKKATIGDSDAVKVGEGVIAIGNALGYGQSVTTGVISAKDREAIIEDKTMKLLQTDAAINGGNSGGALLNSKGEVIGINVAKYSSSDSSSASIEGMGFAIPISSVKDIISNLETKETRTKVDEKDKGYLGIVGYDVDQENSSYYGLPVGICVQSVSDDSPAKEAGIKAYDVITKFDGQTVNSMSSLQSILDYYKAGEKVTITISRNSGNGYAEKELTIKLGSSKVIENMQND